MVAFGTRKEVGALVEAWDADSGKPAWHVVLDARAGNMEGPSGCADKGVVYFTVGVGAWGWKKEGDSPRGQTIAIEARTGKVLWKTTEFHGYGSATPTIRDGRLYLIDERDLLCLSTADGKLLWRDGIGMWFHSPAIAPDCLTGRGYSGSAERRSLENGKAERPQGKGIQLGGPEHACGPALLASSGISIAITVGGLYIRDVQTGELLWLSNGFAPRTCSNASASNGRIFCNPQVNNVLYCFEPEGRGR